jgi:hypothetical protein
MIIFAYVWLFFLIFSTLFILSAIIIEKNFDESHPVKKWWRRNVIGPDLEDVNYKQPKDDNQE